MTACAEFAVLRDQCSRVQGPATEVSYFLGCRLCMWLPLKGKWRGPSIAVPVPRCGGGAGGGRHAMVNLVAVVGLVHVPRFAVAGD